MKSKFKEVTRIGVIVSQCNNGDTYVIVPHNWQGLRVFCIRKDDYDRMKREEEKARVKAVGKLTIIEGASVSQLRKPTPQRERHLIP